MHKQNGFSMLLKLYRRNSSYTQVEAGRTLGYSQETIKAWEGGKRFPLREDVSRIAHHMGIEAQELDQTINASRLENDIRKVRSKATLVDETIEAANGVPVLPSSLLQLIPVQQHLLSRHQTIVLLAGVPSAIFRLTQSGTSSPLRAEEITALCATYVPLCWQLYFEGGLTEVQQILPPYLTQLSHSVQEAAGNQQQIANEASKAYQLATCIEMHQHHFDAALAHARLAIHYGQIAEDFNLRIASLIQQANVYSSFKQPGQELDAYQEAMQHIEDVSPLLRGRVYIGLAKAFANVEQEQEALQFLEMANEHYPFHPENDPCFNFTCHSRFTLTNHTGQTFLQLEKPTHLEKAWDILTKIDTIVPAAFVPRRVELSIRQTIASLALNDLGKSCSYLETAVIGAKAIGSPFRYNEAFELYRRIRKKWSNERSVKALKKYFQR
ncbi:MAG: helix-turn-helix domain-containing protein [Ktedonobacteraceae bacterium]